MGRLYLKFVESLILERKITVLFSNLRLQNIFLYQSQFFIQVVFEISHARNFVPNGQKK